MKVVLIVCAFLLFLILDVIPLLIPGVVISKTFNGVAAAILAFLGGTVFIYEGFKMKDKMGIIPGICFAAAGMFLWLEGLAVLVRFGIITFR